MSHQSLLISMILGFDGINKSLYPMLILSVFDTPTIEISEVLRYLRNPNVAWLLPFTL